MKKLIIPVGILMMGVMDAQLTQGENYIQSKTYLDYNASGQPTKVAETVQYFDGLGRPKQVVNVKASPLGKDVVTHIEYDAFGRQVLDFLPIPQSGTLNGGIVPSSLANATQPDIYGSEKIFSERVLENSPLDRILAQKQIGNAWTDKPVTFGYDAVTIADAVKKFSTTTTWENEATKSIPSNAGIYQDGQLYKNTITDEDQNKTIEFKNDRGQLILLRKVVSVSENADTYYVYNEYNQLAFVVPPLLAKIKSWSQADQDNLAYEYRYDGKNRLVEKKLPGKGWESMIYDKQDRLVGTQDAELRKKGQWLYTKYDEFGRAAITGLATGSTGTTPGSIRNAEQTIVDGYGSNNVNRLTTAFFERQGMNVYYGNPDTTYPNSSKWVTLLSLNYYDSYPAYSFNPSVSDVLGETVLTGSVSDGKSTKGLPVMSFVKNIEDDNWTKNYTYYDTKGRALGSYSINHLGGYTQTESKLDFAGVPQTVITRHKRLKTDTERVITENFTYDHQNRLLIHKHQVDNHPEEILAQNKYNELSQLESKKVGGVALGSPLQRIDFKYNIKGWMTKINDPANIDGKLFGYEIRYNDPVFSSKSVGRFNGNIAEIDWINGSENVPKRYNYTYDKLNRLTDAEYAELETTNPHNKNFDERLTYDLNGNIASLKRNAVPISGTTATQVDDLEYQYSGNRLDKVKENAMNDVGYEGGNNTIDYDLNGNMVNMKDKGIQSIVYNYLNLPNHIAIQNVNPVGKISSADISHVYRADGVKLRKMYTQSPPMGLPIDRMTDYLDGFQYTYVGDGTVCTTCRTETAYEEQAYRKMINPVIPDSPKWNLDFVPTSEGFYSFTENRYIYQYRDHLGNTRVSFAKNSAGVVEITDTNNYYPFGLNHIGQGKSLIGGYLSYKYNGKELQETGMYDYGARMYMADIGRWGVVDPLAEKYFNISPFNYTANNPILYIDPDGMQLDLSDIMKKGNEEQYKAFVFFAKTKEGQTFLSKYMEKGQAITYGGKTIFEAKSNGEFHDKGIDLSYGVRTSDNVGSETGGKMIGDRANVNILISRKAFGDSGSQFFNTLEHIVHESFLHADLSALDLSDDGYKNSSSIPKEYRQYDTWSSQHGQHYYIQAEYLKDPTNNKVNTYTKEGFKILKQANEALKLKLGDSQIKKNMWNFNGSYINVAKDGKLIHRDTEKK